MGLRELWNTEPRQPEPLHLISTPSVTPLLGVLVVLVLGYLSTIGPERSLDVQLPLYTASTRYDTNCDNQIVLTYHADGRISINKQAIKQGRLVTVLKEIYQHRSCQSIYIAAAPTLPYGAIAALVDSVKGVGIRQIVMIPDSPGYRHLFE